MSREKLHTRCREMAALQGAITEISEKRQGDVDDDDGEEGESFIAAVERQRKEMERLRIEAERRVKDFKRVDKERREALTLARRNEMMSVTTVDGLKRVLKRLIANLSYIIIIIIIRISSIGIIIISGVDGR